MTPTKTWLDMDRDLRRLDAEILEIENQLSALAAQRAELQIKRDLDYCIHRKCEDCKSIKPGVFSIYTEDKNSYRYDNNSGDLVATRWIRTASICEPCGAKRRKAWHRRSLQLIAEALESVE